MGPSVPEPGRELAVSPSAAKSSGKTFAYLLSDALPAEISTNDAVVSLGRGKLLLQSLSPLALQLFHICPHPISFRSQPRELRQTVDNVRTDPPFRDQLIPWHGAISENSVFADRNVSIMIVAEPSSQQASARTQMVELSRKLLYSV